MTVEWPPAFVSISIVEKAKNVRGEVQLPGDKSISHRAAMLGAIATGETRIENFSRSQDCRATLQCLRDLGVAIGQENNTIVITGRGPHSLKRPDAALDCGNGGTTMRLLAGLLAGQPFATVLDGDDSLRGRPMRRVIDPLTAMGAVVDSLGGCAPVTVTGKGVLKSIKYELPVASAQVKSAVLLAGLFADGTTTVIERTPTRDHTERLMQCFGAQLRTEQKDGSVEVAVDGSPDLVGKDLFVPGDVSAAAFFIAAVACLKGSELVMKRVGINPTRTGFIEIMRHFGATIEFAHIDEGGPEPYADLRVTGGRLSPEPQSVSGDLIPALIDEIPILAVVGTQLDGGLEVRDAAELRIKESDRIAVLCRNLSLMGARIDERSDGFRVSRSNLRGAKIDPEGDHRIAMAFAIAGLLAEGETEIVGAECCEVSFPGFFEELNSAVIPEI